MVVQRAAMKVFDWAAYWVDPRVGMVWLMVVLLVLG